MASIRLQRRTSSRWTLRDSITKNPRFGHAGHRHRVQRRRQVGDDVGLARGREQPREVRRPRFRVVVDVGPHAEAEVAGRDPLLRRHRAEPRDAGAQVVPVHRDLDVQARRRAPVVGDRRPASSLDRSRVPSRGSATHPRRHRRAANRRPAASPLAPRRHGRPRAGRRRAGPSRIVTSRAAPAPPSGAGSASTGAAVAAGAARACRPASSRSSAAIATARVAEARERPFRRVAARLRAPGSRRDRPAKRDLALLRFHAGEHRRGERAAVAEVDEGRHGAAPAPTSARRRTGQASSNASARIARWIASRSIPPYRSRKRRGSGSPAAPALHARDRLLGRRRRRRARACSASRG